MILGSALPSWVLRHQLQIMSRRAGEEYLCSYVALRHGGENCDELLSDYLRFAGETTSSSAVTGETGSLNL